mmetsp:Transcript_24778/g.68545  ORF Transcript_24778/g.68545 Transcript_24778/m.68545 type:complete len:107 (+) Transcript_24778:2703-3023(+)
MQCCTTCALLELHEGIAYRSAGAEVPSSCQIKRIVSKKFRPLDLLQTMSTSPTSCHRDNHLSLSLIAIHTKVGLIVHALLFRALLSRIAAFSLIVYPSIGEGSNPN